ncbi:Lipase/esterase [Novosphingobium resinovorum]|uniref:Lipase/esterase n=1 Tax=Novosphingobium resinovorum TaxID=158500 RepID=A0A031K1L1_9SPHN|nr:MULTISPECIES: alpha/beta hydrolase [Novosphingobium]EZP83104.1 Lipase/esterase [Novosphingobium resinovorum]
MASAPLEELLRTFRAHAFDPSVDEATVRRRLDGFAKLYPVSSDVSIEVIELSGRPAERVSAGSGPTVLYFHGGGYVAGSIRSHRHLGARLAMDMGGTVILFDYRLAPEAVFPAALNDCVAAYAALADIPVSLAGDSAGGGLAFGVAIAAGQMGLPRPVAIWAASPWINLGTEHESYDLLASVDPMLSRDIAEWHSTRYLAGTSHDDPRASPLFANLAGLPSTLIQIGDREVFFGDAVRLHQRLIAAGVDCELSVGREMFHVWHLYWPDLPEGREAVRAAADFLLMQHRADA